MPEFTTLTCPSCGGKLKITEDIEHFACIHCGNEHIVKRGGGTISIAPISESLKRIETHTSKTANEIGLIRLNDEIRQSEEMLRRFFLSNEKQRSFIKELGSNIRIIGKISFFESLSITSEEIIERMFGLDVHELARVVRIEARVRSRNDERIKLLNKYVGLRMEKEGETTDPDIVNLVASPEAATPKSCLQLVFLALGGLMHLLGIYFLLTPNLFEDSGQFTFVVAIFILFGLYCLGLGFGLVGRKKYNKQDG